MKLIFILIFLLFASCYKTPDRCDLANEVMLSHAKTLQGKGLFLQGIGGAMMFDIQEFGLHYIKEGHYTDNEARKLIIENTENFLKQVNSLAKIHPYLRNYPVTSKNLDYGIRFISKESYYPPQKYIGSIKVSEGKVYYNHYNPYRERYERSKIESYEEALKTVQQEYPELFLEKIPQKEQLQMNEDLK